jgi:hypothetical protein
MTAAFLAASTAQAQSNAMPTMPARYVRVPQRLITTAVYHPLLIGVYSLVARLFLVAQTPVPLSAADLTRYDPSLSRGAAQRALNRLVDDGWLIADARIGQKSTYVPTWGWVNGTPLRWAIGAPCFGRPRHVRAICLDLRLFDLFFGKLTPHPQRAAVMTSYFTAPLLALSDVGSYALLLGGLPGATPSLVTWGIARDEQPLPLPDDETIMAQVSQQRLSKDDAVTLTVRGLQKLGLVVPPKSADSARSVFFVPPEVIDHWPLGMPTNVIDRKDDDDTSFTTFQSQKAAASSPSPAITWDSYGVPRNQEDSPPNPPTRPHGGGGGNQRAIQKSEHAAAQPETESARLLRSINAFPSSIEELAGMPVELVGLAIAYAESEPGIESVPGWVVEALRRHRDEGWPIPAPRLRSVGATGRDCPIDVVAYTSGAYGDLFRLGSDTSGLDASACALEEREPGVPAQPDASAQEQPPVALPAQPERRTEGLDVIDDAHATAESPRTAATNAVLTQQLHADLLAQCGRRYRPLIAGLQVQLASSTTLIICASVGDLRIVQHELSGAIRHILGRLGAPAQLLFTTRAEWEARRSDAGNARSRPAALHGLRSSA